MLKECSEIKEFSSDSLKKIVYDMSETMLDYNGIGLAAPQVHISKQIIVFRNPDNEEKDKIEITPLINPIFKPMGKETEDDWEGCLSIPGMQGLVTRFKKIKYSGYDLDGKVIENEVEGLHARVVQHEIDHLNGVTIHDREKNLEPTKVEKKIGRNQLVTIKKGDAVKVLKYKKAQPLLNQGWVME